MRTPDTRIADRVVRRVIQDYPLSRKQQIISRAVNLAQTEDNAIGTGSALGALRRLERRGLVVKHAPGHFNPGTPHGRSALYEFVEGNE